MTRTVNHRLPVLLTRGDCIEGTPITGSRDERMRGQAQCMRLECRHNLLADESSTRPGRRHDGLAPEWTVRGENTSAGAPSCSLDVADTGPKSAAEVAAIVGLSKRRIEQITRDFTRSQKALVMAELGEEE